MRAGHLAPALRVDAVIVSAERSSRRVDGRCDPALHPYVTFAPRRSYV